MSDLRGLSFRSLIKKKKCKRVKRKKLVQTFIEKNEVITVTRLLPWMPIGKNYAWIVSLAVGKSRRQINDWLMRRCRRRRVLQFDQHLTGLGGYKSQAFAARQLSVWLDVIPEGDMIVFICESAEPERQMKVWKKWLLRHEPNLLSSIDEETKSFYIYKPMSLE